MSTSNPTFSGLLVLPRLRIQNANTISSPMTWGFPAISAFIGLKHALERKLPDDGALQLWKVGVICHVFEAQATQSGFTRSFHLTRNPVDKDGGTSAIVEEGRAHLDITLVFEVRVGIDHHSESARQALAEQVSYLLEGMRVAGGSVMPPLDTPRRNAARRRIKPYLVVLDEEPEARSKAFRRLSRRWMPGFALVSRDDLLQERWASLRSTDPTASVLDAWLSLSRLTYCAAKALTTDEKTGEPVETIEWSHERPKGWVVPIPVGYAALSKLHAAGEVANARDASTPLRFVESVYSMGQWISPHRLSDAKDLLWLDEHDEASGLYRCINEYRAPVDLLRTAPLTTDI